MSLLRTLDRFWYMPAPAQRLARGWVLAAWAFHLGVVALMAIAFPYPLSGIAYASFLPVERLLSSRPYLALRARLAV